METDGPHRGLFFKEYWYERITIEGCESTYQDLKEPWYREVIILTNWGGLREKIGKFRKVRLLGKKSLGRLQFYHKTRLKATFKNRWHIGFQQNRRQHRGVDLMNEYERMTNGGIVILQVSRRCVTLQDSLTEGIVTLQGGLTENCVTLQDQSHRRYCDPARQSHGGYCDLQGNLLENYYYTRQSHGDLPAGWEQDVTNDGIVYYVERGSNASLTLDLNPTSDLGRWEGTPPKESTALEYLMSAGNRLSRRDLRNAVKHTKILYEEFWEIPMNHTEKVSVAGSGMKNRYKTIIPNEHSRVLLPDIDNDPLNSYINANYIRGYEGESKAYIATQGPMAHTVMDFWRMIWFEQCPIIVMITKLKEKSKLFKTGTFYFQSKCENYLPERWGVYGDVEVVIDKIVYKRGYVVRHITLRFNGECHSVLHYWYTAWPDHKPPDSPHMLLDLIKEVELRRYHPYELSPRGPVCVHCSAGIGRTGCFIAISIGIRQLREEHSVDALGIVCAMRMDRGGMIQTHEQYDFVHQALAAYERELGEPSVQSITALTTECVTTP
ncbi:hypothetical protein Btru_076002 [Bulinus truncatus]|nr:hypothetical protein Btru_076002 [Bulinus truncatus]